ncbi:MAG: hypothetical protein JWO78_1364 [Micavibrio sp.]|nr:hypothetical protein [Micavibrio sp.]
MSAYGGLYGLNEPAPPPRPKSRARKYINVIIIICVLIGISLFALYRAGGKSESLKQTVEKFLSDETGYKAHIGTLNAVSFYPLIGIDVENVVLFSSTQGVAARAGHANFSTSFWSAASGASIHTLDLSNVRAEARVAAPGEITVERFFIDPADRKVPKLSFKGSYDGKPVTMQADLQVIRGVFGSVYFNFAEPGSFDLRAGDIGVEGKVLTARTGRSLKIGRMTVGGKPRKLRMEIALNAADNALGMDGKVMHDATVLDYDLAISSKAGRRMIAGNISGDKVAVNDLTGPEGIFDDLNVVHDFWAAGEKMKKGTALATTDLNIEIKVSHVMKAGKDLGALSGQMRSKDGAVTIDSPTPAGQALATALNEYLQ